jgi:N6-L-threonylcarbamoyladenine synthase
MTIPESTGVVLGIESSCDETSAAVLVGGKLASVVVSSQFFHERYGGVVPELASRAHVRSIMPIVRETMRRAELDISSVNAVAATYAPGLMGSLLVGLNFAKGLALGLGVPLIGVHHIEAHVFSVLLEEDRPELPFIALIVSGGHTMLVLVRDVGKYELLGETFDDAAGEAFDKVGKLLGLNYPAGPEIDTLAREGDPNFVRFPRAMMEAGNYDFSFSGIKTSVLNWLKKNDVGSNRASVAASFQRAVVDVLVIKALNAAREHDVRNIVCVGGVSANSELRERFKSECARRGMRFFTPRPLFSTDNAAMIAMLGAMKLARGQVNDLALTALPRSPLAKRTTNPLLEKEGELITCNSQV